MKLYKLTQDKNDGWDTYDAAIVAAESEEIARTIEIGDPDYSWAKPEHIVVEYLGEAKEGTVRGEILSSFNAG